MKDASRRKRIQIALVCAAIGVVVFLIFSWLNKLSSTNLAMVSMFEPDEGVLVPFIQKMVAPASGISQFLHQFIFYDYYFYGFPFFALSALIVLPLRLTGLIDQMPLFMVLTRQFISVLPMIAAVMILVYLQDGFKSYRSPFLMIFLLSIPAVVRNNLWWHPDGLTILLVVLTLFFLVKDDLRFGRFFLLAALFTGLATAIKYIGLYYFLAVGLTIFLGLVTRRASIKRIFGMSFAFVLIMVTVFLVSNPFLISHWARDTYLQIFQQQTTVLSEGYGVVYAKGIPAALPPIEENYGGLLIFAIPLAATIWGAFSGHRRLLHALIIVWFIPITITVFFISHFKFQYWLPVALPVFSCIAMLMPGRMGRDQWFRKENIIKSILLVIMIFQFGRFIVSDIHIIQERIGRAENNPRIEFFGQTIAALAPLESQTLNVYYDYRLYNPGREGWTVSTTFDLLNYAYFEKTKFDVLMLLNQRIKDYINPGVQGIDPGEFSLSQQFYRDADAGQLMGYRLVFRNQTGSLFLREKLFQEYFGE
jgi:hypothetical protein